MLHVYVFFYRGHCIKNENLYKSCKKCCKPVEPYNIEKEMIKILNKYVSISIDGFMRCLDTFCFCVINLNLSKA